MRIHSIRIAGLGPIRAPFKTRFVRENCVIGLNGVGKTTMFRAIAGICGSDEASELILDETVDHLMIKMEWGSGGRETLVFETTGRITAEKIAAFKARLPRRVSFPLTEWTKQYVSETVDIQTGLSRFQRFKDCHGGPKDSAMFRYSPSSRSADFLSGDGYRHALNIFMNDTPQGVPVLLDNPARHLDIHAKRLLKDFLSLESRQLIFTTHFPEMMFVDGWGHSPKTDSNRKIIEIPNPVDKK